MNFITRRKEEKLRLQKEKEERKRKEQQRSIMVSVLGLLVCFSILGVMGSREKNMAQPEEPEAGDSAVQTPEAADNEKNGEVAAETAEQKSYEDSYRAKLKEIFSTPTCGFDYVLMETSSHNRYRDFILLDFDNKISVIVKKYTPKSRDAEYSLGMINGIQGSYTTSWTMKGNGVVPDCACKWDTDNADMVECVYSNGNTMGEFTEFDETDDLISDHVRPLLNEKINKDLSYFSDVIK